MWYGYVGPDDLTGVYDNYEQIRILSKLIPYSSFRKFKTEGEAWDFVGRRSHSFKISKLDNYGNTFKELYVRVQYFITEDSVCYNVFTENIGYVQVFSDSDAIDIENRSKVIKVRIRELRLDNDRISSHAIAIHNILKLLGPYVDVDIEVPDHSIYYMLTAYTGDKRIFRNLLNYIETRKGRLGVTVKDW